MIRRPPRSTLDRSSAASDVYKRQNDLLYRLSGGEMRVRFDTQRDRKSDGGAIETLDTVSYTHLRAHETVLDLVCRLLLENTKI